MAENFKKVAYLSMDPNSELTSLSQVDGNLVTHIILAFANIDANGNLVLPNGDATKSYLDGISEFKLNYPKVKLMISVNNDSPSSEHEQQQHNSGGGSGFNRLAHSAQLRQHFARSSIEFLQRFQLDGIDLDWEFANFPNTFGHREYERAGLTKILMELRSAIIENYYDRQVAEQHHQSHTRAKSNHYPMMSNHIGIGIGISSQQQQTNVEPYLLTVAIGAQEAILRASYELKQLTNLCDWLNVMSYDYYLFKAYAPFTGPISPLHPIVDPFVPVLGKLSFVSTINRLLTDEVERDKIVMGIPTYARAYRLVFKNTHPATFTFAYSTKAGTKSADHLTYREVCDILVRSDTIVEFDQRARVPYLLTDDGYTWVSYENERSLTEKLNCIMEYQLAGFMTWNLNSDYFRQSPDDNHQKSNQVENGNAPVMACTQYPLHRILSRVLKEFKLEPKPDSDHTKYQATNNYH